MADPEALDYLPTGHLADNLRGRSVRGGATVLGVQLLQFVLNLVSTATLARLLTPGDFGLVSMAVAVEGFLMLFLDMGIGSAIIQRATLTRLQINTLFWISAGLGLAIAVAMAGLGPVIARFYGHPELVRISMALALLFVISGVSVQHFALLRRQMRFSAVSAIDAVSLVSGVALAIASAALGAGYWALVIQQLAQQSIAALGAWIVCGWRPGRPARASGMRPLIVFAAGLTRFNVLNYLSRNVDNIIIGRMVGDTALGLYLKSYALLMLPVDRIRGPATAVVVPALSHLQDDLVRFRRYYLKAITAVVTLGMPVVVFLFVFADDAILLILGPQWRDSILLFRVLAPAAFVETFNTIGSWACLPFGHSSRLVRWQTFVTGVLIVSFFIGVHWGVLGVAVAFTAATLPLRLGGISYLLRGSPIRPIELFRALSRPALASILAGVVIFFIRAALAGGLGGAALLLAAAPAYGAFYLVFLLALPNGRATLAELVAMAAELLPRSSSR